MFGIGLADQNVDALDVKVAELAPQLAAGLVLDRISVLQQLEHGPLVGHVAEIRAEHRVERLRDQFLDVPEPLNDVGRFLIVDVHDDRERQARLVRVLRDQVDRTEAFVVAMRLGPAGDPVQNEVGRRHQDDVAGISVESILARPERLLLNAAFPFGTRSPWRNACPEMSFPLRP